MDGKFLGDWETILGIFPIQASQHALCCDKVHGGASHHDKGGFFNTLSVPLVPLVAGRAQGTTMQWECTRHPAQQQVCFLNLTQSALLVLRSAGWSTVASACAVVSCSGITAGARVKCVWKLCEVCVVCVLSSQS